MKFTLCLVLALSLVLVGCSKKVCMPFGDVKDVGVINKINYTDGFGYSRTVIHTEQAVFIVEGTAPVNTGWRLYRFVDACGIKGVYTNTDLAFKIQREQYNQNGGTN